ncbi:class I SAM-dependent methyltransferase [Verrucomicrobiaceae bacterium 5K15]|nr:class I SAM-dependent methyltransferase [Oceaniferula flavus]
MRGEMIAPTQNKHAGYSSTYHDKKAAQYYQKKFSRSLSSRVSSAREKLLVAKALRAAGRLAGQKTKDLTILDYPCGAGRFATLLASRTAGYYAGDHSPHMVELAAQTLSDHGMADSLLGTTVGDIKANTLADSSVDLAASIRLLHHFPDRADRIAILSELRRVCKGQLITTFIDANSIKQRL